MATPDELRARLAKVEAVAACCSAAPGERATAAAIAAGLRRELAARGAAAVPCEARADAAALERERARVAFELNSSTVQAGVDAYWCAPAGTSAQRAKKSGGWALYDARGYYAGATLPERPKGLKPHTKAPPAVKARIVEDAPKRRP